MIGFLIGLTLAAPRSQVANSIGTASQSSVSIQTNAPKSVAAKSASSSVVASIASSASPSVTTNVRGNSSRAAQPTNAVSNSAQRTGTLAAPSSRITGTASAQVSGTVSAQGTGTVSAQVSGTASAQISGTGTGTASAPAATESSKGVSDASALPNGISRVEKSPMSDFCRQFVNNNVAEANGTQLRGGGQSCSNTPLGLLPDVNRLVSTLITAPEYGATIDARVDNAVVLNTRNLDSGFFNDPNKDYYLIPSTLSAAERIVQGHQHITVQALGNGAAPPDPKVFGFFKGINDKEVDPSAQRLQAVILANTLKQNGLYRICSISGSAGHQSALAPVQSRGPSDDCIRVNVINAEGRADVNVASDTAENTKITVNGTDTTVAARTDNSGRDAGGGDINQKVNEKNQQRGQQGGGLSQPAPAISNPVPVPAPAPAPNTGNQGNNAPAPAPIPNTGNQQNQGNTGNQGRANAAQIIAQLRQLVGRMQQILSQ